MSMGGHWTKRDNEDSPQQATGYQKEVGSELAEETKQASGNPPTEIEVLDSGGCSLPFDRPWREQAKRPKETTDGIGMARGEA
jgi:hypothetical protein